MARPVLIANTPRASLRPLGAQGQTVAQAQQQIAAVVAASLSPRHALLFAEPVSDPARDQIAWYTTAEGKAQRLAEAAPETQQKAREAIATLADDIRTLAASYTGARNPQQRQLGQLLDLAQSFPGEECVFLVGEQPVIVAWGYASTVASAAEPTTLTRYGVRAPGRSRAARAEAEALATRAAAAESAAGTSGAARHAAAPAWVFWILFLLAGFAVGSGVAWAIQAGPLPIIWTAGVPTVVSDPLAEGRAAEARLRQEIADLSVQIAQKQLQCTVPPAPVDAAPEKRGDAAPSPDLTIPPNAARTGDLAFLDGCWDTISEVTEGRTKEQLVNTFCFKGGAAKVTFFKTTDGQRDLCSGAGEARFDGDGRLVIDETQRASCSIDRSASYARWKVACQTTDGLAYCTGMDVEGPQKDVRNPLVLKRSKTADRSKAAATP